MSIEDGIKDLVLARFITRNTDVIFYLTHSWQECCYSRYGYCPKVHDIYVPLPSRVVDVWTDEQDPILFISNGGKAKWVTLSYCWGDKLPLKTTMDNVKERCRRIPIQDLPALFHDAVIVTRRLGFCYLWIDALCIIQDS